MISGFPSIMRFPQVKSVCGNQTITAGNDVLLHMQNIAHPVCETEGSVVHVSTTEITWDIHR